MDQSGTADKHLDPVTASVTVEEVQAAGAATVAERQFSTAIDPTVRAKEISPDLDRKIRESLAREIRRIKFNLFFRKFRLQIELFPLKIRLALWRTRLKAS